MHEKDSWRDMMVGGKIQPEVDTWTQGKGQGTMDRVGGAQQGGVSRPGDSGQECGGKDQRRRLGALDGRGNGWLLSSLLPSSSPTAMISLLGRIGPGPASHASAPALPHPFALLSSTSPSRVIQTADQ